MYLQGFSLFFYFLCLQNRSRVAYRHRSGIPWIQCLLDFLQPLSSKDFQDIEDEVNQAICSYLTCNKYTDGSLQVVEPVPVLVCVIVGSLLIGGFCLCYYVVYTLSYPEHSINNESFCNGATQVRFLRNTKYHNNYIHHQNKKEIHRTHR
ncbi:c2H2-type domain-containing protein [Trichonephila clavata]|uniref:C2H2-type domain-containing protein n=1 Tax=Trichonephila clavata TaxID=2740835 RepID=A0A8X6LZ36_TRICU|nr:c2H2-type domain-containing protein [Trichonephila clavata]